MKKRILIPTLIIGTLLTGSLALAAPGFGRNCDTDCAGGCKGKARGAMTYEQHEERMGNRLEMMGTVLDLNESQKAQIEVLLNQQWAEKQSQREQMQAAREEMRAARTADDFNEADFRAKAAKMNELKTEMMVDRAKMKEQVYAILTPEQQQKADKLGGMMGGQGKGHHGKSRHGGMGFRL